VSSPFTETGPIEGVYLSDSLDLPAIFGKAVAAHPDLKLYRPDEVPDPARIRFALVWNPGPEAFKPYPNLDLVQVIAAGVDGVLHHPGLPADAIVARVHDDEQAAMMAGFALWHVIWHHRRMEHYLTAEKSARWSRTIVKGLRPPSKVTVGVLGYGLMGRAIAKAVAAVGFPVLAAARTQGADDPGITRIWGESAIMDVAARSDILINVLPLTDRTRDLLDARLFTALPRGATLIQLGRGEHLVEEDLLHALDSGQLGGASLDVFREEPLPSAHPFWAHPAVRVTPHEASVTSPSTVAKTLARSVSALLAGERPQAAVDRKIGY